MMINSYIRFILLFVFLVLAQVLIFDNLYMIGFINLFVYIFFVMMLPIETNRFSVLILAFILGLSVDIFNSTPGLHASATTLMAYFRPFVLSIYSPRDGYDAHKEPGIKTYGVYWFLRYAITLILIHHTFLFFVEVFTFTYFFHTIAKIILSSVSTLFFVVLAYLLFSKK